MISKPLCIAVSGGKGGTGKSTLARNLGLFLSTVGKRVVLLDFSSSAASMDSLGGMGQWRLTAADGYFQQQAEVAGFMMLHCPQSPGRLAAVHGFELEEKRFDVIVADLPPDRREELLGLFLTADIPLAVMTPGPEAVLGTLEFISRLIFALVERESEGKWGYERLSESVAPRRRVTRFLCPQDILLEGADEELRAFMGKMLDEIRVGIVLNEISRAREFELGPEVENFARKILALPVVYVGGIEHDAEAAEAGMERRAVVISRPDGKASADIKKLGRRFISCPSIKSIRPPWKLSLHGDENYYELLQTSFASPAYEIKGNFDRLIKLFKEESFLCSSIHRKEILERLAERLEKAFAILDDKDSREDYKRELSANLKFDVAGEEEKELDEDIEWALRVGSGRASDKTVTGSFIREKRERMGLSFQDIVSATKIGADYLRAIEEENYVDLPDPVYIRGFLKEIARILDLDPEQVAAAYLKRMKDGSRDR